MRWTKMGLIVSTLRPRTYADLSDRARDAARSVTGVTDAWVRLEWRADAATDRSGQTRSTEVPDDPTTPLAMVDGGPLVLPSDIPPTLCDALMRAARTERGTTYIRADGAEDRQTYRELLAESTSMLSGLRGSGLRPGDPVLLHCDDNRNFVTVFWACLLGGFVPTPVAMAPTYRVENATTRRIRNTWELLERPPLVTDRQMARDVRGLTRLWDAGELTVLVAEELYGDGLAEELYAPGPEHPVVHLLTSGSTGVPKCVRHSHRTIVTRSYVNGVVNGFGSEDVTLNFMPLDHVGGMVMHNLRDVVLRCEHVNARMASFMADPLRWLTWIERYRATNTFASNFVITLITNLADEISRRKWDLSSMKDITNGGEAIVSRTTHDFLRILAPHGLRPDSMRPAFGMSETCGGVVHSTLHRDDVSAGCVTVDEWGVDGRVSFLPEPRRGRPTFTELGSPVPGTSLRIVDAEDRVLPENQIGRLQFRGPSIMVEYFKNPEANAAARTADGWFDTGDLGFVHEGRLTMTGRDKDVLVIRSANYPCHEVEAVAESVEGVLPTFVAACSEHVPASGTDELVLFCAISSADPEQRHSILRQVSKRLTTEIGIRPRRVVPIDRDAFPKTSAGKIERRRLMADYEAGAFDGDDAAPSDSPSLWLYRPVWVPTEATRDQPPTGCWVVFDDGGLTHQLGNHLPDGVTVVCVRPGANWIKRSDVDYSIDPTRQLHFDELLAEVRRDHGVVSAVLHGWAVHANESIGSWADKLERSVLSVHRVLKASLSDTPRLLALTTQACPTDAADPVEPLQAAMNGLIRTANAEFGTTSVRQLDLSANDPDMAPLAIAELAQPDDEAIVATRSGRRFVQRLRPLAEPPDRPAHRIHPGGLYLVTGGLGLLGYHIGRALLSRYGAKLLVNGRTAPSGERATRLAHLEALGEVTYVSADVTDESALAGAVAAAEDRHGRALDGVIHLAGADISGYWDGLESHSLAMEHGQEFHRHYETKVGGTLAVAAVLEDRPEALLIVASSVNGYFGGVSFGAYSSASSFLPAFVEHWRRRGRAAQCHSWSRWVEDTRTPGLGAMERRGFRAIDVAHATDLFEAALADTAGNVLIGLDDSKPTVAREVDPTVVADFNLLVSFKAEAGVNTADVRAAVATSLGQKTMAVRAERFASTAPVSATKHESNEGEKPLDELEAAVAQCWQKALKQEKVGRNSDFFDLGGDSLSGMMVIGQLNSLFGSNLGVSDLYEMTTLAEIVQTLRNSDEREAE
ncbi:SDR family NAD(P)-dependent oxidoreductase [Streptomyces sp. NPDC088270]|uniref:SDR family NAD(P)-dependent oxidoreductase n=1 Tax=Streptomyces sp. NPDC088270 TaxID=3160990 RepID=UPI0034316B48